MALVIAPDQRVNQQAANNHQNRNANAAAAQIGNNQDADDTQHDMQRFNAACQHQDIVRVKSEIQERSRASKHDNNIVPGHIVYAHASVLACRVNQIANDNDTCQKARQLRFGQLR